MGFDLSRANTIQGWMNSDELQWLYDTALEMDSILEIGAWCGKSTFALCSGCKGVVYSVDHFNGSPEHQKEMKKRVPIEEYRANMKDFANLITIMADSVYAAAHLPIEVDMLFIDGAHEYESVVADIAGWGARAKKLVGGHDWSYGSVQKAVKETWPDETVKQHGGNIWYIRRGQ